MAQITRWGILGTGRIAGLFATGLASAPGAALIAVGSRTQEAADAFGDRFTIPRRHASYEALAADPDVDVIYVSTPHTRHADNTLLCLNAGKAVLCEKPFALNARQAEEMVALARAKKLFLMEAMWSRYYPAMVEARRLLKEGAIGEPRMLAADLGFRSTVGKEHRLRNPALGGGALLDVGVYPVSFASMIFGEPKTITSQAKLGETGVDEQAGIVLGYDDGQFAVLYTSIQVSTLHEATVMGTEGTMRIGLDWHKPTQLTLLRAGQAPDIIALPFEGNGYNYEATEVMTCLHDGKSESAAMPLDESLGIMRTLDTLRGQWGLRYPDE
ncbi:MAG: Gfo/Idh/MocA family protein [Thermomicrobiales bacterium]